MCYCFSAELVRVFSSVYWQVEKYCSLYFLPSSVFGRKNTPSPQEIPTNIMKKGSTGTVWETLLFAYLLVWHSKHLLANWDDDFLSVEIQQDCSGFPSLFFFFFSSLQWEIIFLISDPRHIHTLSKLKKKFHETVLRSYYI